MNKLIFVALVVSLFSLTAGAVNLQNFHFSNNPGFATVEDGLLTNGLITNDYKYIMVGSYNYVRAPFIELDNDNRTRDIIEWMHTLNIGGAYRFSDSFQLGFSTFATSQNGIPQGEDEDSRDLSLGDTIIDLKWRFYQSGKTAIGFNPRLILPTGNPDRYTSDDSLGYYFGFVVDHAFKYAQVAMNFGHSEKSEARYLELDYRRQFQFSVGLLVPLTKRFDLTAEFFRDSPYDSDNEQIPSEANVGLRYQNDSDLAMFAGLGSGSLDETSGSDVRMYLGLKFFPTKKKRDKKIRAEEKKFGKLYRVDNIYFSTGSTKIEEGEKEKLDKVVYKLQRDPYVSKIVIEGYASRVGSAKLNKKLGAQRSLEVKKYLTDNGASIQNIKIVSYGNEKADMQNLDKGSDRKVMIRIYRMR